MLKRMFFVATAAVLVAALPTFGQIADNTVFFDYDFTASDQITAETDADGLFTGATINRGPFVDGLLGGDLGLEPVNLPQVGFQGSDTQPTDGTLDKYSGYLNVDTANGYAIETQSLSNYNTANIFVGQPKISVGDSIRLISEISFDKPSIEDASAPGTFIEGNSQDNNFFFGFRAGSGGGEFQPTQGVAQAFRFNLGGDPATADDSTIQAYSLTAGGANGHTDGQIAAASAADLGLGVPNNSTDLNPSDVFRIVSDVTYASSDGTSTSTFSVDTKIETADGTQLGSTVTTVIEDTGIFSAGERLQFAIRDGASGNTGNPQNTRIHRLAAIFNPNDSAVMLGDFDADGDVDYDDLDQYINNLDSPATGALAQLDLNGDEVVDINDFNQHLTQLVQTTNGQTGTFAGDTNRDGKVDVLNDAATLIDNLNATGGPSFSLGNSNADDTVDVLNDAAALINNLNNTNEPAASGSAASAVPEPGSLSLLALAGLTVMARRRR